MFGPGSGRSRLHPASVLAPVHGGDGPTQAASWRGVCVPATRGWWTAATCERGPRNSTGCVPVRGMGGVVIQWADFVSPGAMHTRSAAVI